MVLRTSIENGAIMNLDLELLSTNIGWVRCFLPIFTLPSSNILIKFPYKLEKKKKTNRAAANVCDTTHPDTYKT